MSDYSRTHWNRDEAALLAVKARLRDVVCSNPFLRAERVLSRTLVPPALEKALVVTAIELAARPRWMRGTEWVAYFAGRCVGIPRRHLPKTLGVFQIPSAKLRVTRATPGFVAELERRTGGLSSLADQWNGAGWHPAVPHIPYSVTIDIATELIRARRSPESRKCSPGARSPHSTRDTAFCVTPMRVAT